MAVLVVVLAAGLLFAVAGDQVRATRNAGTAADSVRGELVRDVRERTASTDRLSDELGVLRRSVTALRTAALGADAAGRVAATQLEGLELVAGAIAVQGPGLVVVLDDAPKESEQLPAERGGQPGDGRVLDRDLQDLVNGLWAAGAEAVSVNDVRLTALTAIRSAGEAVLVDFRPLSPPYTVRALGNPKTLEPAFADGPAGRRLSTATSLYGFRLELRAEDSLQLPGAGLPDLRHVHPGGGLL
ncbi:MAG TPA: DUF881 domain-containing protein [Mycobacteriales bacterium]|nr:DUF881 domain-containing protein [Mycobacteriales bacterium]